jgi:Family of unknown function (DUF5758)/Pentapeptide repeats (8 copies)
MNVNGYEIRPCADLRWANLHNADLRNANLHSANLRNADLRWANLHSADLHNADLRGADLRGADLRGAGLHRADLRETVLRGADLRGADLSGADLTGADLRGANLNEAYLNGAVNVPALAAARLSIVPAGAVTGWKKARAADGRSVIVELLIPAEAARSNATGRKCRAEYAGVVSVDGGTETTAYSKWEPGFAYRAGETVRPLGPFNTDRWDECASGIHFFITREEAEDY